MIRKVKRRPVLPIATVLDDVIWGENMKKGDPYKGEATRMK
jgi:hypothetical protein